MPGAPRADPSERNYRTGLLWVRQEILPHAIASERLEYGLAWEFAAEPGLGDKLARLVALERECCSDIVFEHRPGAKPGGHRLEIGGIDPDAAVFHTLRVQDAGTSLRGRFGKSAGFGLMASFLVCCVLPVGAVSLLGATAAVPFASLDNPLVIAGAALFSGGAAWWWQKRPAGTVPAREAGCTCGPGC